MSKLKNSSNILLLVTVDEYTSKEAKLAKGESTSFSKCLSTGCLAREGLATC